MKRKIYRMPESGKLAGICAGIGDAFAIDPTIIRLATVFVCVITSFVPLVVVYLVGWFIIPEKSEVLGGDASAG